MNPIGGVVLKKKTLLFVLLFALSTLLFSSCKPIEENREIRAMTEDYLDTVIHGERADIESKVTVNTNVSSVQFHMRGVSEYELKQVEARVEFSGTSLAKVTYLMTAGDRTFTVKVSVYGGVDRLHDVEIIETTWAKETAAEKLVLNIFLRIYTLLIAAFTIWMIVDCVRRDIKYKLLWITVIVLSVAFETLYGNGLSKVMLKFGIHLTMSGVTLDMMEGTVRTFVAIPVGAIIYYALRRRFTKPQ